MLENIQNKISEIQLEITDNKVNREEETDDLI